MPPPFVHVQYMYVHVTKLYVELETDVVNIHVLCWCNSHLFNFTSIDTNLLLIGLWWPIIDFGV